MRTKLLFKREVGFRMGNFLAGLAGLAAFAACITGTVGVLSAHDHQTDVLAAGLEERTDERMAELRDEARKFSINLGFNCMLLPAKQSLRELYADGKSSAFFSDADIETLSAARLETINHLRPILRQRVEWPEQRRRVILVGVRGEVYIKAPRWQKPIEEAIVDGKAHLGIALAQELELKKGDVFTFMGQGFQVEHLLPQTGNEDDFTIRVNLETARQLLSLPGKTSAVLALMCSCADGDPNLVKTEVQRVVAGTQVVDFTVRAKARKNARSAINERTKAASEDVRENRAALRAQIAGFARILIALTGAGALLLLSVLMWNNVRERRAEIAMLRALGATGETVLRLFLLKAFCTGLVGGIVGIVLGIFGAPRLAGAGATVPLGMMLKVLSGSVLMALIASAVPAILAVRQDPAGILNRE